MQINRWIARLKNKRITKIKLAAVAKNEAAYLCEWIFHHLYFGFDHIEVHYNGCTDNTEELAPLMGDYPVSFICADSIFMKPEVSPQIAVYQSVLRKSKREGFDAVVFLDIDEFWTPVDLQTSIKDVVAEMAYFDTLSFQWKNKQEQKELFDRAIQMKVSVQHAPQIKTLLKTYLTPRTMNAHGILDRGLLNRFEDGGLSQFTNEQKSRVPVSVKPVNAFILHRKERSEREYLASLLRGRPIKKSGETKALKDNRKGFRSDIKTSIYSFPSQSFDNYNKFLISQQSSRLDDFQEMAQDNVLQNYMSVLKMIKNPTLEEKRLLTKLLHGVKDENVADAMAGW
ncbi:hypothetical protein BM527_16675 [Alteromonas sp. Mex14]|nr:hypothetical protein BM527_16675 [Alteromonas sp. Mex14]